MPKPQQPKKKNGVPKQQPKKKQENKNKKTQNQQKSAPKVPKTLQLAKTTSFAQTSSHKASRPDHLNVAARDVQEFEVALIPSNSVVYNTTIFAASPDNRVLAHAEACLYSAWHTLPPDVTNASSTGIFNGAMLRNYLVWAFIDKMRKCGMVANLAGSTSNDVYSTIPPFPETFAIPTGFAHFIKAHLPYRHPSGATYSWLFQLPDPAFFTTATASELTGSTANANGTALSQNWFSLSQQTPATFTEYVNSSGAGTAFTWAKLFQNARTINQWYAGAVKCTNLTAIGDYANDASAYASHHSSARSIQCPVAEFSGELAWFYRPDNASAPVGYLHSQPVPSLQYDANLIVIGAGQRAALAMLSYHYILNQCEWHPHIHKSLTCGPFPGLHSLVPAFVPCSAFGYATALESAVINLLTGQTQDVVVSALVVYWSAFIARMSKLLQFSCFLASSARGRWAFDPSYRMIPLPTALEEWISGVGPVVKDGRLILPSFDCPSGGGNTTVASRSWLNMITGMTGSLPEVHQVISTNFTWSTSSPFGINVGFTNGVADTPIFNTSMFRDRYDTIPSVPDYIAPSMPEYGLNDFMAGTVYDITQRQFVRTISSASVYTGQFLYSTIVNAVGADFVLAGQDVLRVASHMYTRLSSAVVYGLPYMIRMGNVSSPAQMAYDYISTSGFNVLNNTLANAQAEEKPGVGYGGFTFVPKKDESIGRNALRQIMTSYWNEDSAQSMALTNSSFAASAKKIAYSIGHSLVQDYLTPITSIASSVMKGVMAPGSKKNKILTAVLSLGKDMFMPDVHQETRRRLPQLTGARDGPIVEDVDD